MPLFILHTPIQVSGLLTLPASPLYFSIDSFTADCLDFRFEAPVVRSDRAVITIFGIRIFVITHTAYGHYCTTEVVFGVQLVTTLFHQVELFKNKKTRKTKRWKLCSKGRLCFCLTIELGFATQFHLFCIRQRYKTLFHIS